MFFTYTLVVYIILNDQKGSSISLFLNFHLIFSFSLSGQFFSALHFFLYFDLLFCPLFSIKKSSKDDVYQISFSCYVDIRLIWSGVFKWSPTITIVHQNMYLWWYLTTTWLMLMPLDISNNSKISMLIVLTRHIICQLIYLVKLLFINNWIFRNTKCPPVQPYNR